MEETSYMPSFGLGPIEGGISVGLEHYEIAGVRWIDSRTNAEANRNFLALNLKFFCERLKQAVGQEFRGGRLLARFLDEHKFIAPHSREESSLGCCLEPSSDRAQELIADRMTEDVVDLFKMIEIDNQKRETRSIRHGAIEDLRKSQREESAIWQIRQRIMMSEMGDLFVSLKQLRSRRPHRFARYVKAKRRLFYLLLENVEAFPHLAELITRVNLDRHDVDRHMCCIEIPASQSNQRAGGEDRSVPWGGLLAA